MFPLTRPVRQGLATAALVVFTILPTAFVGFQVWRINRPGHVRDVEIELGRALGLQVTLESVRYPRPGEVSYRGLVLRQEEPRGGRLAEIARAGLVTLVRGDRELTVSAEDLKLRGESPAQAVAQLGAFLSRSGELPAERINLTAPTCVVHLGEDSAAYTVQELAGEFVADPVRPALRLAYRMAGDEAVGGTRCELTLERDRAQDPATTALSFRTVEGPPLPARVLDPFFPSAEWLGIKARVEGTLRLSQVGTRSWEAGFEGHLVDIDLATLFARRFPRHQLSGTARLTIRSAAWGERPGQGPGWREVRGELHARQGAIGQELLVMLSREMRFRPTARAIRPDPHGREIEFHSLGIGFAVRPDGAIVLSGALGNEFGAEAVLASTSATLLLAPPGAASVHGLIKTLFPVADLSPGVLVPLTAESRVLLCLPTTPEIAARPARTLGGN